MKTLLLKPYTEEGKKIYTVNPISLGYLAQAVRNTHEVRILDCENAGFGKNELVNYLSEHKPQVAGITVFSHNKATVNEILSLIKSTLPDCITVIGGPHVNSVSKKVLDEFTNLDYAMQGECEESFLKLLNLLEKNSKTEIEEIPGIILRKSNGSVISNSNEPDDNITKYDPMPYDLIKIEDYFKGLPQGFFSKHNELVSIITSRGCCYPCTFCAAWINNGKKIRYRELSSVLNEIDKLVKDYKVKEIHILDDNFTFKREYAVSFCKEIIRKPYKIKFALPNGIRLDKIDRNLLLFMKDAGFYALSFGIESGSDETLKKIKKLETKEFIRKQLDIVSDVGFRITGTFLIGLPWETKDDILETLKFAKSLPLDHAAFGNFTPLPGTEITDSLIASGELDVNYETPFTWGEIKYAPKAISAEELKKLQRYCVISFYFPRRIWQVISNMKLSNVFYIIRRILLLFK